VISKRAGEEFLRQETGFMREKKPAKRRHTVERLKAVLWIGNPPVKVD
jgi:hypothetical protein